MTDIFTKPELDRRTLLRRAAAVGLLATPAVGMLSACVGSSDETPGAGHGDKSADNPLGIDPKAAARDRHLQRRSGHQVRDRRRHPAVQQEVAGGEGHVLGRPSRSRTVVQPRINAGDPPDMINNSALEPDGLRRASSRPARPPDLTDLFAAPSLDIAGKTVKDTLVPGAIEQGTFDGKPFAVNYAFTVFGLWYNNALFKKNSWTLPTTWAEFTALLRQDQGGRHHPVRLRRRQRVVLHGPRDPDQRRQDRRTGRSSRTSTTSRPAPGRPSRSSRPPRPGPRSAPSTPTRRSSASSTPRSSCSRTRTRSPSTRAAPGWRTSRPRTPRPASSTRSCRCPSVTASDKLPATAIYAAAGEMYFAAARARTRTAARSTCAPCSPRRPRRLHQAHQVAHRGAGRRRRPDHLARPDQRQRPAHDGRQGRLQATLFEPGTRSSTTSARAATNELMFKGGTARRSSATGWRRPPRRSKDSSVTSSPRS